MRRPFILTAVAVAAIGLFSAGFGIASSGSDTKKLSAKLSRGAETPRPKGALSATGTFTGTLSGSSLTWKLTFSHLTGKALAAHIHLGRPGVAGPVAVPLCGPCVSGVHKTSKLTSKVKAALLSGGAYVNVHTAKNAAGEIRGQVTGGGGTAGAVTSTEDRTTTTDDSGGGGGYGGYG
jgi:CHRD domain-containing protein